MDFSSWARKLLLKKTDAAAATTTTGRRRRSHREAKEEEEHLGLTEELRELVKSFTIETFKTFPLQDDQQQTTTISGNYGNCGKNVEKDLSEWQERHAMLVLSQVKACISYSSEAPKKKVFQAERFFLLDPKLEKKLFKWGNITTQICFVPSPLEGEPVLEDILSACQEPCLTV